MMLVSSAAARAEARDTARLRAQGREGKGERGRALTARRHPRLSQRHRQAAAQGYASLGQDAAQVLNADLAHHTLADQRIAQGAQRPPRP